MLRSEHIRMVTFYNPPMKTPIPYTRGAALEPLLAQRIVILDGAMGTMIQRYKLTEADYRGSRFADHPKDLKGNNELLQFKIGRAHV